MSHRHESIMFMCALVIGAGFAAPAAAVPTERNLYVTDSENGLIYLVTPSKSVSVLVSEADITSATGASEARFTDNGMFFDLATEKLYFTDSESDSILVRDSTGAVSVIATEADIFAVTGAQNADDEDAARPEHIILVGGSLYVTDEISESLLKVNPTTGAVSVHTSDADFEGVSGIIDSEIEGGIAVSPDGKTLYVTSDEPPNTVFAVDVATGTPSVLASFGSDLDTFLTLAPNGDVIVADDDSSNSISRVTSGGVVTAFLDESTISSVIGGGTPDLEGGIAFDEFGNFFLAEEGTDGIYRWPVADLSFGTIDTTSGALFLSEVFASASLGVASLDYEGGIAFGTIGELPEPGTLLLLGVGLVGAISARRRHRPG